MFQKNVNIVNIKCNVIIIEWTSFHIDFKNVFILISLNIFDIELKEDSNTNESENFNVDIQTYLISEGEYKEFIIIRINFKIVKKNDEEYPYNKDNFYFKPNNIGYYNIV